MGNDRLLTEDLRQFIENHILDYHKDMGKSGNRPTLSPSSRAREIIAKTASIKDEEFKKKCKQCSDATEKAIMVASGHLEAECQERVERIKREIEQIVDKRHREKYGELLISPIYWQEFWEKELK